MMKHIRGFLMAWGNFCNIPCPYHKWHEDLRRTMLIMLPWIGLFIGIATSLLWTGMDLLGASPILTGALVVAAYYLCSGFMHLDGFMDVNDAILSRRPSLGERQRILKASDTGAMAVISVVLIMLVFAAAMISLAGEEWSVGLDGFLCRMCLLSSVFVVSRTAAVSAVLSLPKMDTSQYADQTFNGDKSRVRASEMAVLISFAAVIVVAAILTTSIIAGSEQFSEQRLIRAVLITVIVAQAACFHGRKNLGGMNGDISGYMIVSSEIIGIFAAAL